MSVPEHMVVAIAVFDVVPAAAAAQPCFCTVTNGDYIVCIIR